MSTKSRLVNKWENPERPEEKSDQHKSQHRNPTNSKGSTAPGKYHNFSSTKLTATDINKMKSEDFKSLIQMTHDLKENINKQINSTQILKMKVSNKEVKSAKWLLKINPTDEKKIILWKKILSA